ncbi:4-hydroxythreonine-4-phosphate dehydrogenase PdxA [Aurantiacibacter poecillastricola]|uniref:4-hydroxythreonine-4-phosphate dehydrogenase PdxA n=1 Tax=Aurantiacibacter poecillastricola TaxID=3064385 RepID=UPI00273D2ECD|nr:4-hydroxythreonine-4-phosphate dehydrogenase PdxA [Aurantiacibacter sp. 219JJ12-13]MDP5262462.1 4-hydroxythreonine-4-phosphate dehydrogenase PdxA [Aurantiacibacter sp. 219JJ12-13]
MADAPLPLAVTIGDPAGVGPELILEAWSRRDELRLPPFVVIGGVDILREAGRRRGIAFPDSLVVETGVPARYTPGDPLREGALLARAALERAAALARKGEVAGIVTAPVAKAAIFAVDESFVGQTEFCADACDAPRESAVMMLAGPSLRTVPMTVHCALSEVPSRLSQRLIVERTRIVARAMHTDFGIAAPRIAIAGLNPHAGEDGRMGTEEIDTIAPAIATLRGEGIDATGPHPADTLFAPHKRGSYDVAIAMYHDQALVPLKTLDFDEGVNVTLGLSIVRTSPDHGTAFDIAGKGVARPEAMIAAIRMAGEIAARRAAMA